MMIRILSTSLACIFKYPEAIDLDSFLKYLEKKEFKRTEPKRERIISESGILAGEIEFLPTIVAKKTVNGKRIEVFYNRASSLIGFPDSSFITVVGEKILDVLKNFRLVLQFLESCRKIDEIAMYEATLTGFLEFKRVIDHIPKLFSDRLHVVKEVLQEPQPIGFRLRGKDPRSPKWYDLLIDCGVKNPNLALVRFVVRYDDYTVYENIESDLKNLVEKLLR